MTQPAAEALIDPIVRRSRVMAVVTVDSAARAVPLARALGRGGAGVVEVTLRTPAALEAIAAIAAEVEEVCVGAGTCLTPSDLEAAQRAGAAFAVSPGLSPDLMRVAAQLGMPYLPGVATASEVMLALAHGHRTLKLFPAVPAGGVEVLKAWRGPFPGVRFCPTGGITAANAAEFLALENVVCVGGSWLLPATPPAGLDQAAATAHVRASLAGLPGE